MHISLKSMKILSNNMPSIYIIYEYGNITLEESFDIDISENPYHRGNIQMYELASLFPSATRRHRGSTQNARILESSQVY